MSKFTNSYFPSVLGMQRVDGTHPYLSLPVALGHMAIEFANLAANLGATLEELEGEFTVLGKRIGSEYELEWTVRAGIILFRHKGQTEWADFGNLCDGMFDFRITRMVFVEAVHCSLWWHLYYLTTMKAA